MAGKYDSPLKRLVEDHPQDFVDWLTQKATFKRVLKTELTHRIIHPAVLMGLEHEQPPIENTTIIINKDRMAFLEDEMTTRWDMYYTGGTIRAARGLDLWIQEITQFAHSTQGTAWHERTLALLTMSYQLQSCVSRDMMAYPQAHAAYQKAFQIAKEVDDPELMGAALAREGVTLLQQDKPAEAVKYLRAALKTINNLGVPILRGYILQALSEAYAKAQQPQECWQSIGQAERILERREHMPERSRSRFNTASVMAQKGIDAVLLRDHERAIALIDKSLISYDPTVIRGRARLVAQKAEAYYGLGWIDASVTTAEEALTLARSVGSNKTIARINKLHTTLIQSSWRKERSIALYVDMQRMGKRPGIIGISILVLVPITAWITLFIKGKQFALRDRLHKADAIIVLAGTRGNINFLNGKIRTAVDLYKQGWAPSLIFTGKFSIKVTETPALIPLKELQYAAAQGRIQEKDVAPAAKTWDAGLGASYMAEQAIEMGVPLEAILIEQEALHTRENAEYVLALLKKHQLCCVILVTSPFHQLRPYLTFAKYSPSQVRSEFDRADKTG